MQFNTTNYQIEEKKFGDKQIRYRAFRNIPYVENLVNPKFQVMNIFVPEAFYDGKSVNGYNLENAPTFVPIQVGGYMPALPGEPGFDPLASSPDTINAIFYALLHGYIVASPGIRGRSQKDDGGIFNGKAPACIVDYKAAVRYLHYFSDILPGDQSKIITNGTSAGGALSSLMGATGDHPDYEAYLAEIGAADASDAVFAASCYCPITNLEHADMAYEWQFNHVTRYSRMNIAIDEGGRPEFTPEEGELSELQKEVSNDLAEQFPAYINSLNLRKASGELLMLTEPFDGTFMTYIKQVLIESAKRALEEGKVISDNNWLTGTKDGQFEVDFKGYASHITRMKEAPAFDDITGESPENDLFGTKIIAAQHFTEYSYNHRTGNGSLADSKIVKMMNPMNYIDDVQSTVARHWRVRHGEKDRDTSIVISALLVLKLIQAGHRVDYHVPWDIEHGGDYDLNELFAWIDSICS